MSALEYVNTRLTQDYFYSQENCQRAEDGNEGELRNEQLEKVKEYLDNHHLHTASFKSSMELAETMRKIGPIFQKKLDKYKRNVQTAVSTIESAQKLATDILSANSKEGLVGQDVTHLDNRAFILIKDLTALEAKVIKIHGKVKTPHKYNMTMNMKTKWNVLLDRIQSVNRLVNNVFKGCVIGIGNSLDRPHSMVMDEPSLDGDLE